MMFGLAIIALMAAPEAPSAPSAPPVTFQSQTSLPRSPVPAGNPGNWVTSNDYPAEALRAGASGATAFRVTVGPDGAVTHCEILRSSGNASLDQTTCDLVSRRARFTPARDEQGHATTGTYSNNIRWTIPKMLAPPEVGQLVRSYDIERNGTIANCRVDSVSGAFVADIAVGPMTCAENVQYELPVDARGKPVRKHVVETLEIRTEGQDSQPAKGDAAKP